MFNRLERFRKFMGEARFWMLLGLLASTSVASVILAVVGGETTVNQQTLLALGAFLGAALLITSAMDWQQRLNWLAVIAPAFGLVVIGVIFVPQYQIALFGAALGWLIVSMMTFNRAGVPIQYRDAIKAMRRQDYKVAVAAMDALIKMEPDNPAHYRLRGRILRLWGKAGRARRDYEAMIAHSDDDGLKAEASNELAEVELQSQNYEKALEWAQKAYDLLPGDWVAAYNLGLIQDRLGHSDAAIDSLKKALEAKITDSRHRLLVYLWLTRAYTRLGRQSDAASGLESLKKEKGSLAEWQKILEAQESQAIQDVLATDIHIAEQLIQGEIDLSQLGKM